MVAPHLLVPSAWDLVQDTTQRERESPTFPDLLTNGHAEMLLNERGNGTTTKPVVPLNEAEKGEYTQYIQRHEARRQTGREADKLAKIVDKYLPDVSQETRSYMIRFPHEVHKLLAKARRIRRKLKAKRERQAVGNRPGRTSTVRKAKAEAKQQRAKRAATSRGGGS